MNCTSARSAQDRSPINSFPSTELKGPHTLRIDQPLVRLDLLVCQWAEDNQIAFLWQLVRDEALISANVKVGQYARMDLAETHLVISFDQYIFIKTIGNRLAG